MKKMGVGALIVFALIAGFAVSHKLLYKNASGPVPQADHLLQSDEVSIAMMAAIQTTYSVDSQSFIALVPQNQNWGKTRYASDAHHVFAAAVDVNSNPARVTDVVELPAIDPVQFEVLAGSLAKDNKNVYLNGVVQPGIDGATFKKVTGEGLYGDSHAIYYFGDTGSGVFKLMSTHPNGFILYDLIAQDPNNPNGTFEGYWSDGQTLYYGTTTVAGVNPARFTLYPEGIVASSSGERWMPLYYGNDSSHIFYQGRAVVGADPTTFITVSDGAFYQEYGKDKNRVYFKDKIIQGADPSTFKPLKGQPREGCGPGAYAIDSQHVFYQDKIVEGADPVSFKPVVGENDYGEDMHGFYIGAQRVGKSTFVACQYG